MVKVVLWGSLRSATGGLTDVVVEAKNTGELLKALAAAYPELEPIIDEGVSVAIDGLIYKEAWFTPIKPDSEVVLMPYMKGG